MKKRPLIAFFDCCDVFEDFYPHYGVDQKSFATSWADTGSHAWLSLIQKEIGDVIWYSFSLKPELNEADHEVVGCKVKFLKSSLFHRLIWKMYYKSPMSWRWVNSYRAYKFYGTIASYCAVLSWPFLKMLKKDKPDIFFIQEYSTGRFDMLVLMARMLDVPVIVHHAGGLKERYLGKFTKRWSIPMADQLIVSSRNEFNMLKTKYKVQDRQAPIILTPIDTQLFSPMDRTKACLRADLDPSKRYYLFVGRLQDPVKRISSIIHSFAALMDEFPDLELLIVGSGPDEEALMEQAAHIASGRIHFLGWISDSNKKNLLYNAAECLLLPSLREGFPTVVGEAMACSSPVLASDVGGISEMVIEGETGWLVKPGDDEALEDKMRYIALNLDVVQEMRSNVRKVALEKVSHQAVTKALEKCFNTK